MAGGISPTLAMWLNVLFLILTGVAAGSYYLGEAPELSAIIKGFATDAALGIGAINVVFHAFASQAPGPVTKLIAG